MNQLEYTPGTQYALVREQHVVLLPEDADPSHIVRLWEAAAGEGANVSSLLSEIFSASGQRIDALPPFVIVSRESAPHVVIRGAYRMHAMSGAAPNLREEDASGVDVATWQERRFRTADVWSVEPVSSPNSGSGEEQWWPIGEGIVRVAALRTRAGASVDSGAPAAVVTESVPAESVVAEPAVVEPTLAEPAVPSEFGSAATSLAAAAAKLVAAGDTVLSPASAQSVEPDSEGGVEPKSHAPEPAAAPDPGAESDFIDSVPWRTGPQASDEPEGPAEMLAPITPTEQQRDGVSPQSTEVEHPDLDGDTVMSSALPQPAAGHPAVPVTSVQAAQPQDDGLTLTSHGTVSQATAGQFVLGRACAEGHANPPTASSCFVCGLALSGDAHQVLKPALGRMTVTDGACESVHELTRSVIVGRQPVYRGQDKIQPRLMQVSSPEGDISRSHVQVRVDGWHVELVDLAATNGTVLVRAGQAPRRLGRHESVLLLSGDIADLGDGVSLRFEDLP